MLNCACNTPLQACRRVGYNGFFCPKCDVTQVIYRIKNGATLVTYFADRKPVLVQTVPSLKLPVDVVQVKRATTGYNVSLFRRVSKTGLQLITQFHRRLYNHK